MEPIHARVQGEITLQIIEPAAGAEAVSRHA
jgi:hypothetical protein